jgi:hypothetical protein
LVVFMARRSTGSRAEAVRRARELRAAREAERARLDDLVEAGTAALLDALLEAQRVRERAKAVAEKAIADGEASAVEFERKAAESVRALRELNVTNAEIAELCGLSVGAVRGMMAQARPASSAPAEREAA